MEEIEAELQEAVRRVLESKSRRKLVVAGPGTGKTTLFKELLSQCDGKADDRLVLTFINTLRADLEGALGDLARVNTLHSFCLGRLYSDRRLRGGLTDGFRCLPGLARLIAKDWEFINDTSPPRFVRQMRELQEGDEVKFYLARGNYYDAVDFDDSVYRVHMQATSGAADLPSYELVLIDEYQDFNALEAGIIELLARESPILIAGDDDQALYSQLRDASWEHIRALHQGGEFEVFELPFCMRCPKVVVDATNDILARAKQEARLVGRIEKPYRHFPPAKGLDSVRYPTIALVRTSVQSSRANYMGKYVAKVATEVPADEVAAAAAGHYPALLVIAAKPYRPQIVAFLEQAGFEVETKRVVEDSLTREQGLVILKADPDASLGWRIILEGEATAVASAAIKCSGAMDRSLAECIPKEMREKVLAEVAGIPVPEVAAEEKEAELPGEPRMVIRVTSFEGSKGLSAQHVVIAGLHDGELPHDPSDVQDIEICRFVVGLTRTRKRCHLVHSSRFGQDRRVPSIFLRWIRGERFERLTVDAGYWSAQSKRSQEPG